MTPFRPRFRLEALEDRLTPVSPADVFNAVAVTRGHVATLDNTFDNPGLYTVPTNAPSTRAGAALIAAQSESAAQVLGQFMADLTAKLAANPADPGPLQTAFGQAAAVRLTALTNQGAAQLIVNFIDITNDINSQAQRALAAGIAAGQTSTNPSAGTGTGTNPFANGTGTNPFANGTGTNPFANTTTFNPPTPTTPTNTTPSGIPQNILDQLNAGGTAPGTPTTGTPATTTDPIADPGTVITT